MDLLLGSFPKGYYSYLEGYYDLLADFSSTSLIPIFGIVKTHVQLYIIRLTDTKVANKVLIAKKESIEEGAEHFQYCNSTVHGVMLDDVARFLNLLTTTQFWASMAYLSQEHWKRRCWSITKSMENEIVVEAFMNFRTHT
ncbi:hypothetical protein IGI04_001967, partial [Brassica rapa subsp. trilocularis]